MRYLQALHPVKSLKPHQVNRACPEYVTAHKIGSTVFLSTMTIQYDTKAKKLFILDLMRIRPKNDFSVTR